MLYITYIHPERVHTILHNPLFLYFINTYTIYTYIYIHIDPYYREIKGILSLISKDYINFGYKYKTRLGTYKHIYEQDTTYTSTSYNTIDIEYENKKYKESSPIFIQYIDIIYQLYKQNILKFEFNEYFLTFILTYVTSGYLGEFLLDGPSDMHICTNKTHKGIHNNSSIHDSSNTGNNSNSSSSVSIYDIVERNKEKFINPYYIPYTTTTATATTTTYPTSNSITTNNTSIQTHKLSINPLGSALTLWSYHFNGLLFTGTGQGSGYGTGRVDPFGHMVYEKAMANRLVQSSHEITRLRSRVSTLEGQLGIRSGVGNMTTGEKGEGEEGGEGQSGYFVDDMDGKEGTGVGGAGAALVSAILEDYMG